MKLEYLSALELGERVNKGDISPTEVIRYFVDRIEERNPSLNAFVYLKVDDALREAAKLEKKILNGQYVGPFAGVPVGLKDFLPSKIGWTNSHGGVKCLIRVDDSNSMFYTAAKKLGAIAVGKTNAPAFGFSGACQNKLYGATANPFDTTRTSGGSSGGTAAAVADGLIPLGEGGDAGGSIRIPSGWCNLFGFKASLGTIPSYCRPDGWSATHPYCFNGALTRTVEDSATILNQMAQYNPRDPISLPINSNKDFTKLMRKSVKGMKIGFTYDFGLFNVEPEMTRLLFDAVMKFKDAGVEVEPVKFHFHHSVDDIMRCWAWSISIDTALDIQQWKNEGLDIINDHRDELPEEFIYYNDVAAGSDIHSMRLFNEIRTDILDNFEDILEDYDVIVSPIACCPPMPLSDEGRVKFINGKPVNPLTNFISFGQTPLANFIGYPAASVPMGLYDNRWPAGMQIIGKQYHDEDVIALSYTFEELSPWHQYYDIPENRIIE